MIDVPGPDETLDLLCKKTFRIIQKKHAYRFSMDAILLANFVRLRQRDRMLEIGSGCGIIPLYLSHRGYVNEMLGVEIQEELHDAAARNAVLNDRPNLRFLCGDIRDLQHDLKRRLFHVIVANPPFTRPRAGRQSPGRSRLLARHEYALDLATLVGISASLLQKKGRLYLVYPVRRLAELIHQAHSKKLELKRIRFVHPRREEQANLFLSEFIKDGGTGAAVEKPLYIYHNTVYTQEVQEYYL